MQDADIELGNGRSLSCVQAGEGADVVLLHGALHTRLDWLTGPFDRLSREFRVTAVDRPGYGASRRPRFDGTPREQALQIRAGLGELGIERPVVVGHSLGGLVALALAEQEPEFVASLVLIAPLAFPEPRPLEHSLLAPRAIPLGGPALSMFAQATFDRPLLKMIQHLMFSPQPVPPDWEARYPYEEVLTQRALVAQGEEFSGILPMSPAAIINFGAVRAPLTILTGTDDKIVNPMLHARPLAALMPGARLIELKGIGHMPHQVAQDEVVQAIRDGAARGLSHNSVR